MLLVPMGQRQCAAVGCVLAAAAAVWLAGCATTAADPEAKQALAPTGTLRAAMLADSPTHAAAPGLGRELARRLGVPFEAVAYKGDKALLDSAGSGRWDIIFTAATPERERLFDFTLPYARIETGYLVAPGSPVGRLDAIDQPGVRIAVQADGNADRLVTRSTRNATLIRVATFGEALEMVRTGRADAVPANKTNLFAALAELPGARVLDGAIGVSQQAIGVPKGRPAAMFHLRRFVDEAKASGLMKEVVGKAGVRGLEAAP